MSISSTQKQIFNSIEDGKSLSQWRNWKWQMRNIVRDLDSMSRLLDVRFGDKLKDDFRETIQKFPMSITPYYMSLIDTDNLEYDPIFLQSAPSSKELMIDDHDLADPLHEDKDSPVPGVVHRYPDRLLLLVSNKCAMYCRHCTRKRRVGDRDFIPGLEEIDEGIDYIKRTPEVRDVLLSGGDPLMLPDSHIDHILTRLRAIEHVEIIRIGTRIPVVLPYRITDELVSILKKHHPLFVNTQFNHPRELTGSARNALAKMADAGIPLGNQTVLLAGVNDCPRIMRALMHKLVMNRVRPYYLYQCDLSEGLTHFRTPVGKGIEILESLIGHTSGLCVPTYVIDAPGGGGKIPVMPNYLISWSTNKVVLRNYEGVITTYKEPDSYEPNFCDRRCERCDLLLGLEDADEMRSIGIEKLLSDSDETISLVPEDNERIERRAENGDTQS